MPLTAITLESISLIGYIDPGTGSLLLQMLIAGAVGVMAFFRRYIFGFLFFWKKPKQPAEETEAVVEEKR